MKKILNIFTSISLITTGVASVVACGSSSKPQTKFQTKFNPFNLSTWGNDQKNMVKNTYFNAWKQWYNPKRSEFDSNWNAWISDENALADALDTVNKYIADYTSTNFKALYNPQPTNFEDTKTIFTKGLIVYVAGDNFIKGDLELILKL